LAALHGYGAVAVLRAEDPSGDGLMGLMAGQGGNDLGLAVCA
jgi:hypothetical protein